MQAREFWFLGECAAHVDQWGMESFAASWVRTRFAALQAWKDSGAFVEELEL